MEKTHAQRDLWCAQYIDEYESVDAAIERLQSHLNKLEENNRRNLELATEIQIELLQLKQKAHQIAARPAIPLEEPAKQVEPAKRRILTIAEAAEYCGIAQGTLYRLIREGSRLPAIRITDDLIRIDSKDLDMWLESLKE